MLRSLAASRLLPALLLMAAPACTVLREAVSAPSREAPVRERCPAPAPPLPRIEIPEPVWEWGSALEGSMLEHAFEIRNTGGAQLEVRRVSADCACVFPRFPRTVPPGGRGEIGVRLETGGYAGTRTIAVRVITDDPARPEVTLTLRGSLLRPVRLEPEHPSLRGRRGEVLTEVVKITPMVEGPFEIISVEPWSGPRIEYELVSVKDDRSYTLTLRHDATAGSEGEEGELLLVIEAATGILELPVRVRIEANDSILARPHELLFESREIERYRSGDAAPPVREIDLESLDRKSFRVTGLGVETHKLTFDDMEEKVGTCPLSLRIDSGESAPRHRLRVELERVEDAAVRRCRIAVSTDDPSTPRLAIPVTIYFPGEAETASDSPGDGSG